MIKKTMFVYMTKKPKVPDDNCCHIQELDNIPNGSLDELVCNCLDSIVLGNRLKLLSLLINKVKIEGLVVLHTIDLHTLSKYIMNNKISLEQANEIIGGSVSLVDDDTNMSTLQNIPNIEVLDILYDNIQRVTTIKRVSR